MPWNDKDVLTPQALNSRSGIVFNVKDPDFGVTGDGTTDDSTAIAAMDSSITGMLVFPPGTYKLSSNVTLTNAVQMLPGGIFSIDSGKTLTLNGPFRAELTQAFSGSGSVVLGNFMAAHPEWWGAVPDNLVDDLAALNSAFAASTVVELAIGTYHVSSILVMPNNSTLRGVAYNRSGINTLSGATGAIRMGNKCTIDTIIVSPEAGSLGAFGIGVGDSGGLIAQCSLRDVRVAGFADTGGAGIRINNVITTLFERVNCNTNDINWDFPGTPASGVPTTLTFIGCQARSASTIGMNIKSGSELTFLDWVIESNQEEGVFISNTDSGEMYGIRFLNTHFENNWASIASGGAREAEATVKIVGLAGKLRSVLFDRSMWDFQGGGGLSSPVDADDVIDIEFRHVILNDTVELRGTTTAKAIAHPEGVSPAVSFNLSDTATIARNDVLEGTWTPTLSFATPGDLSVVYATRVGYWLSIGTTVRIGFNIKTSTFTHTTASGVLSVSPLPFASLSTVGLEWVGSLQWAGITKASYTDVKPHVTAGSADFNFRASGSAQALSAIVVADVPTGGTVELIGEIVYTRV